MTRPFRGRVRLGVIATLAVLLCVLVGCVAVAPGPTGSGSSRTTELPAADIAATPRDALATGGELRIATATLPEQWNPWHVTAAFDPARSILDAVSPRFFTTDADGNAHADLNFLAAEPVATGTPLVVRLRLNPKAVWADGTPITWADVAAPIAACRQPQFPCANAAAVAQVASVTRGQDDFEAVVRFIGSYAAWREAVAAPGRAALLGDPNSFAWPAPTLRGEAGPYLVDRYDPATRQVRLVPNPRWWGTAPALSSIVFRSLSVAEAVAAFSNNEVDVLPAELDRDTTARARGVVDATLRQAAGPDQRTVLLNTERGVLADLTVRQAVLAAVDRDALRRADLTGLETTGVSWPGSCVGNRLVRSDEIGYRDNSHTTGALPDPAAARTALGNAGWVVGADGIRTRSGQRLSVPYLVDSGSAASARAAATLADQLATVGIELVVEAVPTASFTERLVTGRYGMATTTVPAAMNGDQFYLSGSRANLTGIAVPALDEQLLAMGVAGDDQQRRAAANRADRLLWEQAATIPLHLVPQNVAVRRTVANFGAFGRASVDWTLVGFRA